MKIANHCKFDEGFNDLPIDALPPNVQHLLRVNNSKPIDMETRELDSNDFCFYIYPFLELEDVTINVPSTNKSDSFGLQLSTDELYN